ncbi:hypothetical protein L873DRAFT_146214 [Choiromyces venosus 120613-1]|uniref:Uncharacterized protein n=1 Tax=Choiromyces venosus 120613-1 TaxID=1336337 RepID=A0A3N4J669_9PEZI|nr:hypothetical protein L873DRAFT_146214 [Choiromyces venosus 120613-1]
MTYTTHNYQIFALLSTVFELIKQTRNPSILVIANHSRAGKQASKQAPNRRIRRTESTSAQQNIQDPPAGKNNNNNKTPTTKNPKLSQTKPKWWQYLKMRALRIPKPSQFIRWNGPTKVQPHTGIILITTKKTKTGPKVFLLLYPSTLNSLNFHKQSKATKLSLPYYTVSGGRLRTTLPGSRHRKHHHQFIDRPKEKHLPSRNYHILTIVKSRKQFYA